MNKDYDPLIENGLHDEIDSAEHPVIEQDILKDLIEEFKTNLELNNN